MTSLKERHKRIIFEIENCNGSTASTGISLKFKYEDGRDQLKLIGTIPGPVDSIYEGGVFKIDISLPEDYPVGSPKMKFITKVWHPNVGSITNNICANVLKDDYKDGASLESLLCNVQLLLSNPNDADPLNPAAAEQYVKDRKAFEMKAHYYTEVYAMDESERVRYKVKFLTEKGFPEDRARELLLVFGGDEKRALETLLDEKADRKLKKISTGGTSYNFSVELDEDSLKPPKNGTVKFTIQELKDITNDFDESHRLHDQYYWGILPDSHPRLPKQHVVINIYKGDRQQLWENEIKILPAIDHPNIIKLIGQARTNERSFSIYPRMHSDAFRGMAELTWEQTIKILKQSASAIQYLHNLPQTLIIREFKTAYISLTPTGDAVLTGMGNLSPIGSQRKQDGRKYAHPATVPDYGYGNKESDTYSFCVTLLQLIMKRADIKIEGGPGHIGHVAQEVCKTYDHVVHPDLLYSKKCSKSRAKKISEIGLGCRKPDDRRAKIDEMVKDLAKLEGEEKTLLKKLESSFRPR